MPTFVLNDETKVNSYGFRIPNKGIDLKRFKSNPVMLDSHWNSNRSVLGKWNNARIEGSQLLADTEFDTEDEDAKKIAGKVDRGFIKGASMGVTFNRDYMELMPDDTWVLNKCELYEASIVAIPSNANAISLFTEGGELISDEQVKLTLSALKPDTNSQSHIPKMEKIILSAAAVLALGLTAAPETNDGLEKAILSLSEKLKAETDAKNALQQKLNAQLDEQANALVEQALLEGKITEAEKEETLKDAKTNYTLTAKLLSKLPAKADLSGKVSNTTTASLGADAPKNIDEFEKMPVEKQLAFKKDNPTAYAALFA